MTNKKSSDSTISNSSARVRKGRAERKATRLTKHCASSVSIERTFDAIELLNEEQFDKVEATADRILSEIGVEFQGNKEALTMWQNAGAHIDGTRVRFPKGLCKELMKTAPRSFIQHARNSDRNVEIGGNKTVFAPVYGPPYVLTLNGERRDASLSDFHAFVKLAHQMPALHHCGGALCVPMDMPTNTRHLDMLYAHIKYSDKAFMGGSSIAAQAEDSLEMCKILFGSDFIKQNCVLMNLINIRSPLVFDASITSLIKLFAQANQASIVSSFIVSGALSPVSVAGTLAQIFAETQVAVAFSQLCRAGSPVVLGSFATGISMEIASPTFGSAACAQILYGVGQFARKYNLPFRAGGSLTGSKILDAQAAYESTHSLQSAIMGGANFIMDAAGSLEGGLVASLEKLYMDADQLQVAQNLFTDIDVSERSLAFDAFEEVPPGHNFLGSSHTQKHFQNHLCSHSKIADIGSYEEWVAGGKLDMRQRARMMVEQKLESYIQPDIDPDVDQALLDFMAQRKIEIAKEQSSSTNPYRLRDFAAEKAYAARGLAMNEAFGLTGKKTD